MINTPKSNIEIQGRKIGPQFPTYFIADIAANHDGDLNRAKDLIYMASEAGADAAKFQHFTAETIISKVGFENLLVQKSHQASWKKSVFEVYKDASISQEWNLVLKETCDKAGITFFTSPYSLEIVDQIDPYVPAYKIGSGDITWLEIINHIASKGKPYIIASGASNINDVLRAVSAGLKINSQICLMQCNTNYTANLENFKYINLNVLNLYREIFPGMLLGLSDHTPGSATVLGAVALGARMIEKHFTDDVYRQGPDHKFSMNGLSWVDMVQRTRELEAALGLPIKKVEDNEKETVILQRRAVYASIDIQIGEVIERRHLSFLRPSPPDFIKPYEAEALVGNKAKKNIKAGEPIRWDLIR